MSDDSQMVPQDPDANPFIDNEAIKELNDKVVDTLRPLGLTVDPEGIIYQVHPEHGMVAMIPALIRPSAKEKMDEDKSAREEFNKMMADQAEAKLEDSKEEVARAVNSDDLADLLFGDGELPADDNDCTHENMHPSGFCMDCSYGMEES